MKTIVAGIFCFGFIATNAQVVWNAEKQEAEMTGVIQFDGKSKEELYDKCKFWMAQNLKSSDEQIYFDEEGKNSIVGTGNILLKNQTIVMTTYTNRVLNFKFSIFFKEGRIKYLIDNMIFTCTVHTTESISTNSNSLNPAYEQLAKKNKPKKKKWQEEFDAALISLVQDLEIGVSGQHPSTDEDW